MARLDRVVARTLKGLFFHHVGQPVPSTHAVWVYSEDGLNRLDPVGREKLHRVLIRPALAGPAREIGSGVVRYWSTFAADDPMSSGWAFEFYESVRFYGVTIPAPVAPDV